MRATNSFIGEKMVTRRSTQLGISTLLFASLLGGAIHALPSATVASDVVDPALLQRIEANPDQIVEALVSFDVPITQLQISAMRQAEIGPVRVFDPFPVVYVLATAADLLALRGIVGVSHVVGNEALQYYGETATVTTRAREAWDDKATSTDPVMAGGNVVNGLGVGIAVIDSGIDATHPDLAPAVAANQKFICTTPGLVYSPTGSCYGDAIIGILVTGQPITGCQNTFWASAADTDTTSGHGTHVAGIVAGRGIASDGRYLGSAPGATVFGLGVGEGISILFAVEALQWVKCNHAANGIKVVTNSWGRVAAYSTTEPINVAVDSLVGDGLVVLFAAGNDGGTGTNDQVNTYARNPTAGVISVANYDDQGTATRTGSLASSSSRCRVGTGGVVVDAKNCPDVSAPGTNYVSTVSRAGLIPATEPRYMPYYGPATGTSMATPHVAGIVALLKQANSSLTPAHVEDVLEDTAIQFTSAGSYPASSDPSNPTNGINFAAGHGLVDAIAAFQDSRVLGGSGLGSPLPQLRQNPHVYTENLVDPQVAAGAPPTLQLQWTEVKGRPVGIAERTIATGNSAAWAITSGQSANFRIVSPSAAVTNVGTTLTVDGSALQMTAQHTFAAPGTYRVESQISFGGTMYSFDAFSIRIVG